MGRAGLSGVSIRAVAPGDLEAVSVIFGYYAEHTVATFEESPRSMREWGELAVRLHGLDLPFLVAESGGEISGYAYASPWRSKPAYRHSAEDSVFVRRLRPPAAGWGDSCWPGSWRRAAVAARAS